MRTEGGRKIPHPAPASKCCFVIQLHFSEVLRCLFRHFSGFYTLSLQMRFTVQALEEGPCAAGGPHVLQIKLLGDDSREPSSWKLFADGACVADGSGAFARECFCEGAEVFLDLCRDAVRATELYQWSQREYELLSAARRIVRV